MVKQLVPGELWTIIEALLTPESPKPKGGRIDQKRRMSKDYERLCASGEALVYAAMIRLMVRRLARV
jgi:transposase